MPGVSIHLSDYVPVSPVHEESQRPLCQPLLPVPAGGVAAVVVRHRPGGVGEAPPGRPAALEGQREAEADHLAAPGPGGHREAELQPVAVRHPGRG